MQEDKPSPDDLTDTAVGQVQLPLPLSDLILPANASFRPPPAERIYCNRNLRMDRLQWVGFDMDYTLAIYDQAKMDDLSIDVTAKKLVERGYPDVLLKMDYRADFAIRGLLIDRKLGNVLKMDRYKYVKKAYHGLRELSVEERRSCYHTRRLRPATQRYHWVDSLFALSEVSVYAAAIDALEKLGETPNYDKLFSDVRECIDEAHRDGSIKDLIQQDFESFVIKDPEIAPTLHKLRSAGKKIFLLTNSHEPYTRKMMTYLLDGELPEYPSWTNYFDIVVTAASKPAFFRKREPFLEVASNGKPPEPANKLERGVVYAGGNFADFEKHLGCKGDQVLYVGDHIYGDVLRAKKESAWRTAMVLQEMTLEMEALGHSTEIIEQADALEEILTMLIHELRGRQAAHKVIQRKIDELDLPPKKEPPTSLEVPRVRHRKAIDKLRARIRKAEEELNELEHSIDGGFHEFWGSLFKAGYEVSSFGDQVEEYACIYMDKVSNLLAYSPMHYFRSPRDRMPHEL